MPSDLSNLVTDLDFETGEQLTGNIGKLLDLLKVGVRRYNAEVGKGFTLTGTELDRVATEPELRAIVLHAALVYLDGATIGASYSAITHSNVAGRTKMDGVEFALAKRRKELVELELARLMNRLVQPGVLSEVTAQELGETLDQTTTS